MIDLTSMQEIGDSIQFGIIDGADPTVQLGNRTRLGLHLTRHGWVGAFVGSQVTGPTGQQLRHDGWPGSTIQVHIDGLSGVHPGASTLVANAEPTCVLLLAGSVDIANGLLSGAVTRLMALVDAIVAATPAADVFVSTIPPQTSGPYTADVATYNAAMLGPLMAKRATNPKLHACNAGGSLATADISAGGIHPTSAGYDRLGDAWWASIASAMGTPPASVLQAGGYALNNPWPDGVTNLEPLGGGRARLTILCRGIGNSRQEFSLPSGQSYNVGADNLTFLDAGVQMDVYPLAVGPGYLGWTFTDMLGRWPGFLELEANEF